MIEVVKKSELTGKINTMNLNVTQDQIRRYRNGEDLIQNIFPQLSTGEREFIKTGITPEEWKATFGDGE